MISSGPPRFSLKACRASIINIVYKSIEAWVSSYLPEEKQVDLVLLVNWLVERDMKNSLIGFIDSQSLATGGGRDNQNPLLSAAPLAPVRHNQMVKREQEPGSD